MSLFKILLLVDDLDEIPDKMFGKVLIYMPVVSDLVFHPRLITLRDLATKNDWMVDVVSMPLNVTGASRKRRGWRHGLILYKNRAMGERRKKTKKKKIRTEEVKGNIHRRKKSNDNEKEKRKTVNGM